MPPTLVTSGCTMSSARLSSQGRKLCRRVMHSPVAIGTGLRSRNALKSSSASGFNGSSNQATSKSFEHVGGVDRPVESLRPERVAAARIDHQLAIVAGALARRADDLLVELAGNSAERPPADLDRPEALRAVEGRALLAISSGISIRIEA